LSPQFSQLGIELRVIFHRKFLFDFVLHA
jgi:hypothetical protein